MGEEMVFNLLSFDESEAIVKTHYETKSEVDLILTFYAKNGLHKKPLIKSTFDELIKHYSK